MKNIIAALLGCALGASVSAFVTHKVTRNKYYKLADKEVKELDAYYTEKLKEKDIEITNLINDNKSFSEKAGIKTEQTPVEKKKAGRPKKEALPDQQKSSIEKPASKKYTDYTKMYQSEEVEEQGDNRYRGSEIERKIEENKEIEIISPEDFGDKFYNFYKDTLYYYKDGVLADESDNVIIDIAGTIGTEALQTFGRYEEDRVCVRNHRLEQDYEIYLSLRDFSEIEASKSDSESPEDE